MMHFMAAVLLVGIFISSCTKSDTLAPTQKSNISTKSIPVKRSFLALGDSYTIGHNVPESDRWNIKLMEELQDKYVFERHEIIARTGWTTRNLLTAVKSSKLANDYDMVSLLIGVNNQYQGGSVSDYRKEFIELLQISQSLVNNESKRVIVLSIPDWGYTPFGGNGSNKKISEEIDSFNAVAKEECDRAKIEFIDITTVSRANIAPQYLANDKLHYSAMMHQLWAKKCVPKALELLK